MTAELLFQSALELPEADRLTLIQRLLESIPEDHRESIFLDQEYIAELETRANDPDRGEEWSEVAKDF